jgi:hypothetical protein
MPSEARMASLPTNRNVPDNPPIPRLRAARAVRMQSNQLYPPNPSVAEVRPGCPARLETARTFRHPCKKEGKTRLILLQCYVVVTVLSGNCHKKDRGAGCALGMVGDGHTGHRDLGFLREKEPRRPFHLCLSILEASGRRGLGRRPQAPSRSISSAMKISRRGGSSRSITTR